MQIYQAYAGIFRQAWPNPSCKILQPKAALELNLIAVSCQKLQLGGPIDGSCFGR